MKIKLWVWVILAVIVTIIVWAIFSKLNSRTPIIIPTPANKEIVIPPNEWSVVQQTDSAGMIRVEWDQKYGMTKVAYCRVVFQTTSQYKLVAPWINEAIEKANVNNIQYTKEPFDSVKVKQKY